MSLAIVYTRANIGIDAPLITVEVHLSQGLPGFTIVGLPEMEVKESRERVRSAILQSGLDFPQRRITINLAPAELPKSGGRFDLAIAIGILKASGYLQKQSLDDYEFLGELALSGELRAVRGILPGLMAADRSRRTCIVPQANAEEAALLKGQNILLCPHLLKALAFFQGEGELAAPQQNQAELPQHCEKDFAEVAGQEMSKRALLIAAAGGHNLLMRGPPGTGKTMLASRITSILPPLSTEQALELAALRSISGSTPDPRDFRIPPFRSPHHSSSAVALTGGGSSLNVGEISLAHHGVLFLDELPEFSPRVLEGLREPVEAGRVQISRARYQVSLPARFQLLAAMNPCPCGYAGDPERQCRCSPERIRNYQLRISGPLLDRFDMQIEVRRPDRAERQQLFKASLRQSTDSLALRQQVAACRRIQQQRCGRINALLDQQDLAEHCALTDADLQLFSQATDKLNLSTRGCIRVLKIARTIADLAGAPAIGSSHLLEAISYRRLDHGVSG